MIVGEGLNTVACWGWVTVRLAKTGLFAVVSVLSFTQPILPAGDERGNRLFQNSPRNGLIMIDVRAPEGTVPRANFMELEFYSKCNTAGPDGLRWCHISDMLHALECRRT